jgi:hypothetical protein
VIRVAPDPNKIGDNPARCDSQAMIERSLRYS